MDKLDRARVLEIVSFFLIAIALIMVVLFWVWLRIDYLRLGLTLGDIYIYLFIGFLISIIGSVSIFKPNLLGNPARFVGLIIGSVLILVFLSLCVIIAISRFAVSWTMLSLL